MKDVQERSQSMAAYANSHAEPDPETSARLRERLQGAMTAHGHRRGRARAWLQGVLVTTAVFAALAGIAWRVGWIGGTPGTEHRGVIATDADAQELVLGGARVRLSAHTLVRVGDSGGGAELELVDGEVELPAASSLPVRTGAYVVVPVGARFTVRRTPAVPLVTVHEGHVVLRGPDLPDDGVTLAPPLP
ncbi:MAG: FecR domain-containing protein [Nannocystaceae bacterium]|nr:FecR domain-containing protein [Nannocystaceae bacterium]